jgi:phage terminase large subunit-like protein
MANTKQYYKKGDLTPKQLELRELAMRDLRAFIALVAPERVLAHCHLDLCQFLMSEDNYQLIIWPRGHQKSTILAYWCAWHIINNPDTTILYASATSDLTEKQINFIKNILTCEVSRKYWPELLQPEEGKRELWRAMEFAVDHWKRKDEVIRYPTCKGTGVGGNITGFHADVVILDDLVVMENAETKTGREDVRRSYSLYNSILNPNGKIKGIGTRYHPEDLYNDLMNAAEEVFDDKGKVIEEKSMFTVMQAVVEKDGEFLWPRRPRQDGKWFGFDKSTLSKIKANYLDKAQFFAQYYNDPSDPSNKKIENFLYYERENVKIGVGGKLFVGSSAVNVYAAIDIAATMTDRSDYTAIVVIGMSGDHKVFVLDIDRFKTDKISVMAEHLDRLYAKWKWIRLRAEVNAAQNLAVEQIKEFNRQKGIFYNIEKCHELRNKELRIMTNLEPRYAQGMIYHYRGGNCQILEDELIASKPPHDDVSDCLAAAIEIAIPPSVTISNNVVKLNYHPRFGGIA